MGELIPNNHPVRFAAEFVDSLEYAAQVELGIGPDGEPLGAPDMAGQHRWLERAEVVIAELEILPVIPA